MLEYDKLCSNVRKFTGNIYLYKESLTSSLAKALRLLASLRAFLAKALRLLASLRAFLAKALACSPLSVPFSRKFYACSPLFVPFSRKLYACSPLSAPFSRNLYACSPLSVPFSRKLYACSPLSVRAKHNNFASKGSFPLCTALYRGADKSLARPDWKNNWKIAIFRPTWRSLLPLRPGWTENLLNFFWEACKS